jgi:ribosomal protein S27AE
MYFKRLAVEDEPLDKDTNVRSKEPKDEPQTDEEYINNLPWIEVENGEDEPQIERCPRCGNGVIIQGHTACPLCGEPIEHADCTWR